MSWDQIITIITIVVMAINAIRQALKQKELEQEVIEHKHTLRRHNLDKTGLYRNVRNQAPPLLKAVTVDGTPDYWLNDYYDNSKRTVKELQEACSKLRDDVTDAQERLKGLENRPEVKQKTGKELIAEAIGIDTDIPKRLAKVIEPSLMLDSYLNHIGNWVCQEGDLVELLDTTNGMYYKVKMADHEDNFVKEFGAGACFRIHSEAVKEIL